MYGKVRLGKGGREREGREKGEKNGMGQEV